MAWQGWVLRVNLSLLRITREPLNQQWADAFLGQRGLASKYLFEEIDPSVDPLSPDNKLILATGPLTGTMASTGGRWSAVTKGALTGAIAASNAGGFFGAELKFAGLDMVIIEGRAPKPVYLLVQDEEAELLDARDFIWGESVWTTEARIRERHQDPQLRIASIGRAGENLVRYACIVCDRDRAAGRSGVGTVMGSKQLKALAVRGTKGVAVRDPQRFMQAVTEARAKLDPSPVRNQLMRYGTLPMMDTTNRFGALPTRNAREVSFAGVERINTAAMLAKRPSDGKANLQRNKACFGCSIGCGRVARIDPTHPAIQGKGEQYRQAGGGLEYENGFAFGPMVGCDDIEAATYVNFICNEQGMDPISFGGALAAAMELFELGVIDTTTTGGVDFSFGSITALVQAAEWTALGEGFGVDLGQGAALLCQKYGHSELSMTVKGQEFPGYDPRAMQGMGLAYATSNRGACHMRASPYAVDFAAVGTERRAKVVKSTQDVNAAIDASGLCMFTRSVWSLDDYAAQLDAACTGGWSAERLREVGERIYNLERLFNNRAGFTIRDDRLPLRCLTEPAPSGKGAGWVSRLDEMLPEYYQERGWDQAGAPTEATLTRLRLNGPGD
ncbi:MAG: aldehyde ferredoxin oxidoreductase family protein [Gammaproteobacteria bacterium]|nr:aldehyde ferredoxin oxidoreductase family protein [Gammaproteobacteria bacterium]